MNINPKIPIKKIIVIFAIIAFAVILLLNTNSIMTPEQVKEKKDTLIGNVLSVQGTADISLMRCTLFMCTDNKCCNTCSGSLILKGESESILIRGNYEDKPAICKGNECEQICYPLEHGKKYKVSGIWKNEYSEYFLEIKSFELVE